MFLTSETALFVLAVTAATLAVQAVSLVVAFSRSRRDGKKE
jgi:hypothetical protein